MSDNEKEDDKKSQNESDFPTVSFRGSSEYGEGVVHPETLPEIKGYQIISILGEGGMGIVYLAEQTGPIKRQVALKVVKPGMDSREVIARFEAERQALAALDHPNIAHVYDAGTTDKGRPYFVMEYIQGIPITDYCDQQRLSIEERLELFRQVCEGIQHAHQRGIIHRDIKPSNILILTEQDKAIPKVIDFGIAKAISTELTEQTMFTAQGQLIGTPEYMSPEQADLTSLNIDTRTDVYSLGVVLYQLLTGALPFDPKTLREAAFGEIQRIIKEVDPPKPSARLSSLGHEGQEIAKTRKITLASLTKRLHKELEWIPLKAMRKESDHRYQSVSDLAGDIQNYLSGSPLIAGPESKAYRIKKYVRRNRLLVTSTSVIVLVLIIGIIASSVFAIKAEKQRVIAEKVKEEETKQRMLAQEKTEELSKQLYFKFIAQADAEINRNNITDAQELLDRCPENMRHWEWFYLSNKLSGSLLNFVGDKYGINKVLFSPDGKYIASTGSDGSIKLWDSRTGNKVFSIPCSEDSVHSIAFSPNGKHIVSTDYRGTVKVWDINSKHEIHKLSNEPGTGFVVSYSPDGTRIVSGGQDGKITIWNSENGKEITSFISSSKEAISSIEFSPDGSLIAFSGGSGGKIRVWDTQNKSEILALTGNQYGLGVFAFSPDGSRIASAVSGGAIKVWNISDGKEELNIVGNNNRTKNTTNRLYSIYDLSFSSDGTLIASASGDGTIAIWDSINGKQLCVLPGHKGGVRSIDFSPNDKLIVSGGWEGHIKVWDSKQLSGIKTINGHDYVVESVVFSPDGKKVASGGNDGKIRIWDAEKRSLLKKIAAHTIMIDSNTSQVSTIKSFAFSPDGKKLASGNAHGLIRVRDVEDDNDAIVMPSHQSGILSMSFSPDSSRLISVSTDGTIKIGDPKDGSELSAFGDNYRVWSVAFSPDGSKVALGLGSSAYPSVIKIWDVQKRKEVLTIKSLKSTVNALAFTPDSTKIASGDHFGTIRIWDSKTGKELINIKGLQGAIESIAYSPDGIRLISGGELGTVKIWDTIRGNEVLTLSDHNAWVNSVAFSPKGNRIVTGDGDGIIKIWETTQKTKLLKHYFTTNNPQPEYVGNLAAFDNFVFNGNISYTNKEICKQLFSDKDVIIAMSPKASFSDFLQTMQRKTILGYLSKGFYDPQVNYTYDTNINKIVVSIEEGQRYKKGQIIINGAGESFKSRLIEMLRTNDLSETDLDKPDNLDGVTNWLNEQFKFRLTWNENHRVNFTELFIEPAKQHIEQLLNLMGYYNAQFDIGVTPIHENLTADLHVDFTDLGSKANIDAYVFSGNEINSDQQLAIFLGLKKGMPLNSMVIKQIEHKLMTSGRFYTYKVIPQVKVENPKKSILTIVLDETQDATPVDREMSEKEELMLKMGNYFTNYMNWDEDVIFSFSASIKDIPISLNGVFSPRKGLIFSKSIDDKIVNTLAIRPQMLQYLSTTFEHYVICPSPKGQLSIGLGVSPPKEDESRWSKSLMAGIQASSIGSRNNHNIANRFAYDLQMNVPPAFWLHEAKKDETVLAFIDENTARISNNSEYVVSSYSITLHRKTGKIIEYNAKVNVYGLTLKLRFEKDAFDKQNQIIQQAFNNQSIEQIIAKNSLSFLARSFVPMYLENFKSSLDLAQRKTAMKVCDQILAGLFSGVLTETEKDDDEDRFTIPHADFMNPEMKSVHNMVSMFAGSAFSFCHENLEQDHWLRILAHIMVLATSGQDHSENIIKELDILRASDQIGPVGYLLISKALKYIKHPSYLSFVERSWQTFSEDDFRKDWLMLAENDSTFAGHFRDLFEKIQKIEYEKIKLTASMFPEKYDSAIETFLQWFKETEKLKQSELIESLFTHFWRNDLDNAIIERLSQASPALAIKYLSNFTQKDPGNPTFHYYLSESLLAMGKVDRALESINKSIELNPEYATAYVARSKIYLHQGKLDNVISDCGKAIDNNPSLPWAYNNRGVSYLNKNEYNKSMVDFTKAIELNSKEPTFYYNRGLAHIQKKDYSNAIEDCTKAIELNSKSGALYYFRSFCYFQIDEYQKSLDDVIQAKDLKYPIDQKQIDLIKEKLVNRSNSSLDADIIEACKEAIRKKANDAESYYKLGIAYSKFGRYQEAIESLNKSISIKPDYAEAHCALGVVYGKAQKNDEAIRILKKAISINPDLVSAHFNLGEIYLRLGANEAAIKEYKQAIDINPDYIQAYRALGSVYLMLGYNEEAVMAYEKVINADPKLDNANTYNSLGESYMAIAQYDKQIEAFKQAIRIKPDYIQAWQNLGQSYYNSEAFKDAIDAYKHAIDIDPKNATTRLKLGRVYFMQGDKKSALEELGILKTIDETKADQLLELINKGDPKTYEQEIQGYQKELSQNPKDMEAYYNLAASEIIFGHYNKALDVLDEAIKIDPGSTDTYNHMVDSCWLIGRYEEAAKAIERSLEIDHGQPIAHYYLAQYYLYKGNTAIANRVYMNLISLDKDLEERPLRTTSIDPVTMKTLVGFDKEAFKVAIQKANEKYNKEMPSRN